MLFHFGLGLIRPGAHAFVSQGNKKPPVEVAENQSQGWIQETGLPMSVVVARAQQSLFLLLLFHVCGLLRI